MFFLKSYHKYIIAAELCLGHMFMIPTVPPFIQLEENDIIIHPKVGKMRLIQPGACDGHGPASPGSH